MLVALLILMSFHSKLVWLRYSSSLMDALYLIPAVAARGSVSAPRTSIDSVVTVVELRYRHILHSPVPVALVGWSGQYFLPAS